MASKDHDKLDAKAAVMNGIRWELGRYARRMQEVAFRVVDEQVAKAIEDGRAINAQEISEIAVNAAKAQFAQGARGVLPASTRRRISKH